MTDINTEVEYIKNYNGPAIKLMEVCGTHTAEIFRSGIRSFLSPHIRLISGPGCPVCVTSASYIDDCIRISLKENHVLLSFGDMLKVPGTMGNKHSMMGMSLSDANGIGGKTKLVYSPFEAIELAQASPDTTFVIAAVGFETTAPAYALILDEIIEKKIKNIKFITALKLAIPAIEWICENEDDINGFLCPGHVSVITGSDVYKELAEKYNRSFVVAGFEANHLVDAIALLSKMIEQNNPPTVINLYEETVSPKGNIRAQEIIAKYYDKCDANWRGIGVIKNSGLRLKEEYSFYEIKDIPEKNENNYIKESDTLRMPEGCRCSDVITGRIDPDECPLFGKTCNPVNPYGPCMVSTEGACGIWYNNI